jgi:oxaloacetate decarboxylase alpha subunit
MDLKEDVINKVNDFFKPVKQKYIDNGTLSPKSMGTDAQALVYKVPGGMLSNMIANLKDMGAMDKFDEALAEIPNVRKDLGYPPLVTPLSQMVGNQAVVNVLMGERYKQISNEIKNYFKGEYGIAPGPVSQELQDKILGAGGQPTDCRIEDAKRTGEEFQKAKEALGDLARSEEDLMSYICFPDQAMKFLKDRKAKEENMATYTIEEA